MRKGSAPGPFLLWGGVICLASGWKMACERMRNGMMSGRWQQADSRMSKNKNFRFGPECNEGILSEGRAEECITSEIKQELWQI